jgi:hypothetical protein
MSVKTMARTMSWMRIGMEGHDQDNEIIDPIIKPG